jgi:hypothetical protein
MFFRVEEGQSLIQGERRFFCRSNHNRTIFYGNSHTLVNMQVGGTGNCHRQTNAQVVSPLFNIEYSFCSHADLLSGLQNFSVLCTSRRLNESLNNSLTFVNKEKLGAS